jgi:hypothetical protein
MADFVISFGRHSADPEHSAASESARWRKLEQSYMKSKEAEDGLERNTDRPADLSPASEEVLTVVRPERVEAGKLVLASSDHENKPLEHSIGEIYMTMAGEDHIAINEQNNIDQVKTERRINKRLYFSALAIFIVAIILLMMKIILLF